MEETKIIYYMDDDKMPYLIKLNMPPEKACLKDFKQALNANAKLYKFFFQTIVDDFGVVKEEIMDDNVKLPCVNGRVVSWLILYPDAHSNSANELNLIESAQKNQNDLNNGEIESNNKNSKFSSAHSVASTSSGPTNSSNNNKPDNNGRRSLQVNNLNINNNKRSNDLKSQQIYDTLNVNKKNGGTRKNSKKELKHQLLGDLNFDDTSTETESLINGFDEMRIHHTQQNQRPSSSNHHRIHSEQNNLRSQFGSFNTHLNGNNYQHHPNKQGPNCNLKSQKLSLDSHQNNRHNNFNIYSSNNNNNNNNKNQDNEEDDFLDDDTNGITQTDIASCVSGITNERVIKGGVGTAPSILSSDLDTTTFFDTENDDQDDDDDDDDEDDDGQFSSITGETTNTTASSRRYGQNRNRKRLRHKIQQHQYNQYHTNLMKGGHSRNGRMSLQSSMSSLTDSTMSLNIITVTLNMDSVNFLGISIVGQSNKGGEGGIYVGSIMSGGAVAQDGRIEPGDMILQVNDVSFENMSNDDAVKVLREAVMKPGPVKLVVAKCWDPNPKGYFTVSKQEPVRPIDPSAWVAHTQAHIGGKIPNNKMSGHNRLHHSISTFGSNSSLTTSMADSTLSTTYNNAAGNGGGNNYGNYGNHQNYGNPAMMMMMMMNNNTTATTNQGDSTRFANEQLNLTVNTDMETVVRAMASTDSGLDVRDRNWLKITIPSAFIGSDIVDWLFNHVEGFPDRRDARKYSCNMLKYGYIRHVVNKVRFSEQCYYVFGDFNQSTINSQLFMNNNAGLLVQNGNLFTLNEESEADFDSVSELDRDALYAPMNYPTGKNSLLPGSYNNPNLYHHQHYQKNYSNLNGIGGPPPPPSYMSSSSSNATSNSTSTTSNNTTTQTIATSIAPSSSNIAPGMVVNSGNGQLVNTISTSSFNSTTNNIYGNTGGIISSDRSNACQFYYPPPLTSFNSNNNTTNNSTTNTSTLSASIQQQHQKNNMYSNTLSESQVDDMQQTTLTVNENQNQNQINNNNVNNNYNPSSNSYLSQSQLSYSSNVANQKCQNYIMPNYNNSVSNLSKLENRSIKSSDYSSSGHGSDVELLSSSTKSKNKKKQQQSSSVISQSFQQSSSTNYYELAQFPPSISNQQQQVKLTTSSSFSKGTAMSTISSTTTSSSTSSSTSNTFKGKKNNADSNNQRALDKIPQELRLSKQSFHAAMGNPCEFFVDVM